MFLNDKAKDLITAFKEAKENNYICAEEAVELADYLVYLTSSSSYTDTAEEFGWTLVQTSFACPEQYNVYDSEENSVGYLRLRHGYFRADYPECGGETVYEANTIGGGVFDEEERDFQISSALKALHARHSR